MESEKLKARMGVEHICLSFCRTALTLRRRGAGRKAHCELVGHSCWSGVGSAGLWSVSFWRDGKLKSTALLMDLDLGLRERRELEIPSMVYSVFGEKPVRRTSCPGLDLSASLRHGVGRGLWY